VMWRATRAKSISRKFENNAEMAGGGVATRSEKKQVFVRTFQSPAPGGG
jgi:hypothetical protein